MGVRIRQPLFTTFGFIGMGMVAMNFGKFFKRKHDKREWFFGHITGMLGGYIATVSAFSAVNFGNWFPWMPAWLVWLSNVDRRTTDRVVVNVLPQEIRKRHQDTRNGGGQDPISHLIRAHGSSFTWDHLFWIDPKGYSFHGRMQVRRT
ncbi:MAG: hypothetical protein IPP33_09610 [Flavobacteriales bacterium]|nr:hypothetical protein [Flavobacteriales bacterium]